MSESSTALSPIKQGRKALAVIHGESIPVRIDGGGFLCSKEQEVTLAFGPELYCARANPGPEEKVMPYQPGYMKLVAAMGGALTCPPAVRDPESGKMVANPRVETYPGTGIIRYVTATAVCLVPNPETGQLTGSVQSITVDAEHILRQALLKIDRDDAVKILSDEDVADARKAGELRGWSVFPLTPPYANICANMTNKSVRDALQTFTNQSATIRQRACSKAERLACDHNPVTRRVWEYGQTRPTLDDKGNIIGPPTITTTVVAWVQEHDQRRLQRILDQLAHTGESDAVSSLVDGGIIDGDMVEVDDDEGPSAPEPRALPDHSMAYAAEAAQMADMAAGSQRPKVERAPARREPEQRAAPAPAPAKKADPPAEPVADEPVVGATNAAKLMADIAALQRLDRMGLEVILNTLKVTEGDDFAGMPMSRGRDIGARLRAELRKHRGSGEE